MFKLFKKRQRGFQAVSGGKVYFTPTRADEGSAGYDFYSPVTTTIPVGEQVTIWTNVKAYMNTDEVLKLYVRSSVGIKKRLKLSNQTGIVDATYYNNPDNEGNIGICLFNAGKEPVEIFIGERIAQGVFCNYLTADNDIVLSKTRTGGFGSSGK